MHDFLILKFHGVLQAWGKHTYETNRPSELFPTRSGVTGFLSAALGLPRKDEKRIIALDRSYIYAVRLDDYLESRIAPSRMSDFHTIQNVRTVKKKISDNPILSRREYLEDSHFTVALRSCESPEFSLNTIESALKKPHFALFLGRKSCPITRPPFEKRLLQDSLQSALNSVHGYEGSFSGIVYSEEPASDKRNEKDMSVVVRDVPMGNRRFATRNVYIYIMG